MVAAAICALRCGASDPEAPNSAMRDGGVSGATETPATTDDGIPSNPSFADFLRLVHEPTCSACHGAVGSLPDWSDPAVAQAACESIRRHVVDQATMPPAGVDFSTEQRQLVDDWTRSGCPGRAGSADSGVGQQESGSGPPAPAEPSGPVDCPSYDDHFQPLIHTRVCANCHGVMSGIPDWGVYAEAQNDCTTIGRLVGSGAMPPSDSNVTLSATERSTVLRWVELGCPRTRSEADSACQVAGPGAPGDAGPTATIAISRAAWDPDKQELRIEGEVSDPGVQLTVEFSGRSEPLVNDGGRFRADLTNVSANPGTVRVVGSDGSVMLATVETE